MRKLGWRKEMAQRAESREQRAESREQSAECREQRAKSREQKVVGAVLEMEEEKLSGERLS
jgi:hypothetical protein